jgi:predicted ATPase
MSVKEQYQRELDQRGYRSDPSQLHAVDALDRCASDWSGYQQQNSHLFKMLLSTPEVPRGVYLHGGVGRGKSFLMDCFYTAVEVERKTRLHFHEFMREVHRELADLQGTVNPLDELGARMAKRHQLICFDEFHVADITDALILHRLLAALFDNGVGFVATSNFKPDDLYPDGLHRDRILPAIALLNRKLEVIRVDNGVDYRGRMMQQVRLYHTPLGAEADRAMDEAFPRREPGAAHRVSRDPCAPQGRRCGLVRLQHLVRRPALAERLPGNLGAISYRPAQRCSVHASAHGVGGAPIHLAHRRALRPPRQTDHVGRGCAGGVVYRRAARA